jgi:hypothetical protein
METSLAFPSPQRLSPWYNEFVPCTAQNDHLAPKVQIKTSVLCTKCEPIRAWLAEHWTRLKIVNRTFDQVFDHYDDSRFLEPSARGGCHLCTLFWHNLDPKMSSSHPERLAEREKLHKEISNGRQVQITVHNKKISRPLLYPSLSLPDSESLSGEKTALRTSLYFHIHPNRDVPISLSSLQISTATPAATHQAKEWIAECMSSHPKCASRKRLSLPTRLVDVLSLSKVGKVRTVETRDMSTDTQYATLSYCWGTKSTFKVTKSTWQDLTSGVPIEKFPRTIQDAIKFTRSIDLEFLWIDSLCIIQDSEEDWNREAANMCEVYQGSFLTIAGLGASSSEEGLFAIRDPLLYSPCFLFETDQREKIYAGQDSTIGWVLDPWPLHQRGWVTQERILPLRTLNFGPYLIWQCQETILDEYNIAAGTKTTLHEYNITASDRYKGGFNLNDDFYKFVIRGSIHAMPSRERDERILDIWEAIVALYSRSTLTVTTDRLVAISGILAATQRRTGWTNLSGLCEPFLWKQLLWERSFFSDSESTGLIPSWSWIAITGEILWLKDESEEGFFLNPIAHVKKAGNTALSQIVKTSNGATQMSLEVFCLPGRIDTTHALEPMDVRSPEYPFRANLVDWPLAGGGTYYPDILSTGRQPELFLPIGAGVRNDVSIEVHGLAVSPSSTFDGAFERVGLFTFRVKGEEGESLTERNYALLHDLS